MFGIKAQATIDQITGLIIGQLLGEDVAGPGRARRTAAEAHGPPFFLADEANIANDALGAGERASRYTDFHFCRKITAGKIVFQRHAEGQGVTNSEGAHGITRADLNVMETEFGSFAGLQPQVAPDAVQLVGRHADQCETLPRGYLDDGNPISFNDRGEFFQGLEIQ